MSRFAATFARLRERGECGLFPWLMAGFPDVATSRELARAALEAGADGFEIGVPFSDPLADGTTMQRANTLALERGATTDTALELARFIRSVAPEIPIALMSYYNPVARRGEEAFAALLAQAGADALIVADLPADEARPLRDTLAAHVLDLVPLVAPTTTQARIPMIVSDAGAFVYCVALVGVTGVRSELSGSLARFLSQVRAATPSPLVVGFGISRPEHLRAVAAGGADGAIVASALADLVESSADPVSEGRAYLTELKAATRRRDAAPYGSRTTGSAVSCQCDR